MTLVDDRQVFLAVARAFRPRTAEQVPYWSDPVGWARDCIRWPRGQGLRESQARFMANLIEHKREAVRGPHGLGKTTAASLLVLWFALTREAAGVNWKIGTTASAWQQLTHYLWPEIHEWAELVDWAKVGRKPFNDRRELLKWELNLRHGRAWAMASDRPAAMEGAHADHLLIIFDEAKEIPSATWDAIEGAFSTAGEGGTEAFALAISTPAEPLGRFYEIHARAFGTEDWHTTHVRLKDAINDGSVTDEWVEQHKRLWGEKSAIYQNRVLGEFASSATDGVIPLTWLTAANDRWRAMFGDEHDPGKERDPTDGTWRILADDAPVDRLGVDIAEGGGDNSTIAFRVGNVITEIKRYPFVDNPVDLATIVMEEQKAHQLPEPTVTGQRYPKAIVDSQPSGVFHFMRKAHRPVEGFVAAEGTKMKDLSGEFGFLNKRALAWWNLREMLDPSWTGEPVALPPDDKLTGDLLAPRYREITGGRIQVEMKEEIRKRIGRSTDDGDAVVMVMLDRNAGSGFASYMLAEVRKRDEEVGQMADEGRPLSKGELAIDRERARLARLAARPTRVPRHDHLYVRQPDGAIRCNVCQGTPAWVPKAPGEPNP